MKPDDIVKFKYKGMKTKFRVMCCNEVIKNTSIQCLIDNFQEGNPEEQYTRVLSIISSRHITFWTFTRSVVPGDKISEHSNRVYLEQLSNLN